MTLAALYLSGETRRWHANPAMAGTGQTIADHQCRAAQLLLALHPGAAPALVYHVLHHDVGEAMAGDLPRPFKAAQPDLAAAHAGIEAEMAGAMLGAPLPHLTPREADWAKLVDMLEAACFTILRAHSDYFRPASGWRKYEERILSLALDLGCRDLVASLLEDMKGHIW